MNSSESHNFILEEWLRSRRTVRISGLDLEPLPHPVLPDTPRCVMKGQASVYFFKQHPHGHMWLIKKFAPSRRPSDHHLLAVSRCIPGQAGFFTCTQRRILQANHLDQRFSGFKHPELVRWIDGTILMPRVPGSPWISVAETLCDNDFTFSWRQRLKIGSNLATCIALLESCDCSHRDLSSTNVFVTPEGDIYLIDWDCLYHPELEYEPNTTAGTNGYIAPFMRTTTGQWQAQRSWCQHADR